MSQGETARRLRVIAGAVGVAAAYFALGKACNMLSVQPIFAAPIWLPAGLALAGTLLWGWRVAPGIVVGAVLLRVDVAAFRGGGLSHEWVLSACLTGGGAWLQAYAGAWAVRHWVGMPPLLARGRDIVGFMALGAAGCLVNPTVSSASLIALGLLPWDAAPAGWATWWIGDVLGVFVMAPLVFVAFAAPREFWRGRLWTVGAPLVLGAAAVAAGFVTVKRHNEARDRQVFARNAEVLTRLVKEWVRRDPSSIPASMELVNARKFAWKIEELPQGGHPGRLFEGSSTPIEGGHPWRAATQWQADGSQWRFRVEPTFATYAGTEDAWLMWVFLAGGFAGVGLLGAFLLLLTGRAREVEAEVLARTAQMDALNQTLGAEVADRRRAEEGVRSLARELEQRVAARTGELEAARTEAEAASRAKSAFLANISHEVRTPMNGILGVAEMLRGTRLDVRQREWLDTLRESGETLTHILNAVLDLSKIEAGRMALEETPFSLRREMAQTMAMVSARAEKKGLVLTFAIDDAVPDALRGDALRFRQITLNLLDNAVKFTPHGSIGVRVSPGESGAASGGRTPLRLEVADTGVGIPPGQLGAIFDAFAQADASVTRKFGGTGLGLAICARLVKLMGGTIRAENRAGGGSVFTVELALPQVGGGGGEAVSAPGAGVARPVPSASAPASVSRRRVLAVEDNRINQMVLENLLTPRGHQVALASHGGEALEILAREEFDIILMDVQMPVMDGFEALRRIRAEESATARPRRRVVALTASAMRGDREICMAAGMDGYLAKPIQPEALYAAVESPPGPSVPPAPLPSP